MKLQTIEAYYYTHKKIKKNGKTKWVPAKKKIVDLSYDSRIEVIVNGELVYESPKEETN